MTDNISTEQDREESDERRSRRVGLFTERARYAYILCLWTEPRRDGKQSLWRFSLEEVESGVRHGFSHWEALQEFLRQRMEAE